MSENKQPTCEERIDPELEDWLKTMRRYLHKQDLCFEHDQYNALDRLRTREEERLLAVSTHKVVKIEYSWGGPQDYFEVHIDEDGEPFKITYHFLDWFDGAQRNLGGDAFDDAARYFQEIVYWER